MFSLLRRGREPPTHLKHEQSPTANSITQLASVNAAQRRRKLLRRQASLHRPGRIGEAPTNERLIRHARTSILRRTRRGIERLNRDEQFLDRLPLLPRRRRGRRLDLDAEHALRGVRVEVARERAAARADVWEESERADVRVGEGQDVAADDGRRLLLSWLRAERVDVEDDLAGALLR